VQLIGIGCASFDYGAQFILSERSESKGASAEDDKGVWVIGIGCAPFDYGAARLRSDDKGVAHRDRLRVLRLRRCAPPLR
jgi:hypothetical protein